MKTTKDIHAEQPACSGRATSNLLLARLLVLSLIGHEVTIVCAQQLQVEVLASFNGYNGSAPSGGLTLGSDGSFYGTTSQGGSGYNPSPNYIAGYGTVFKVTTNGVLTTLVSFTGTNGSHPEAGLTQGSDGNFYGTTSSGGNLSLYSGWGGGTVFRVTTNGILTTLISFNGANGAGPAAPLTQGSDGNFYGTTRYGGPSHYYGNLYNYSGDGTIFRVTPDGAWTTLVSFAYTNGAHPAAGLILGSDGNLYGTTMGDDVYMGTVFRLTTNGVLTTLASFYGVNGAGPAAGLTLGKDGNFYGTTSSGGSDYDWNCCYCDPLHIDPDCRPYPGDGTIFRVTTNGELTTLVSFSITDGAYPRAGLTLGSDGNFYGTSSGQGFVDRYGTVFQVTKNGELTTLVSFSLTNGAYPLAGLTLGSDGNFYGTTSSGGSGVIYRLRHGAYLQSFAMTTNGFQINALTVGGSGLVVLESSSDLTNWAPIQTNGTAAAQQFLDPSALTQPRQFYRVRQQ